MLLPRNTHRYFIEPLSGTHHIIKSLWKRFLRFIDNIAKGEKRTLRTMLESVKSDTRSTTGNNLRHLKLKTTNCDEKELDVFDTPYRSIPSEERWCLPLANELVEEKRGKVTINLAKDERNKICEYVYGG